VCTQRTSICGRSANEIPCEMVWFCCAYNLPGQLHGNQRQSEERHTDVRFDKFLHRHRNSHPSHCACGSTQTMTAFRSRMKSTHSRLSGWQRLASTTSGMAEPIRTAMCSAIAPRSREATTSKNGPTTSSSCLMRLRLAACPRCFHQKHPAYKTSTRKQAPSRMGRCPVRLVYLK
jgi:hypothetical protein